LTINQPMSIPAHILTISYVLTLVFGVLDYFFVS
jgi:hypothetical protein